MESRVERGTPTDATVTGFREPMDLHVPEVVVLQFQDESDIPQVAWVPLRDGQSFGVGQDVSFTRVTTFHENGLGGSHTFFEISPK